jgi:hypothetical protein
MNLPLARDFLLRNARLLERRIFAFLFEGGPREMVLSALRAYQNPDGGFGGALEPDMRTLTSQPVFVEEAFKVLDLVDAFSDPIVNRACGYLLSITTPEGGLPSAVAGVDDSPRTPWWNPETAPSINPTASLAGLLYKHSIRHPWLERADRFCRAFIEPFEGCHYHDVINVVAFLEQHPDRTWAAVQMRRILARLPASGQIAYDRSAGGYIQFPLDWAPRPDDPLRPLFPPEVIWRDAEALAAQQQLDGGWPITWQAVGTGAEMEWRGLGTLRALWILRANGFE